MYTVVEILQVVVLEADGTLPTLFGFPIKAGSLETFEALVEAAPSIATWLVESVHASLQNVAESRRGVAGAEIVPHELLEV